MNSHKYNQPLDPIFLEITKTLEAIYRFQRRFFPPEIAQLREDLPPYKESLKKEIDTLKKNSMASDRNETNDIVEAAANLVLEALETILNTSASDLQNTMIQVMKSFRKICRAQENLYPIRHISTHLNLFFLEPQVHYPLEILDPNQNSQTGLVHKGIENDYYARGAMSIYVPESYDSTGALPLVVALHGGFGHGRDFIWAWLREARSRNFILLSPTSIDTTWSILDPQLDGTALYKMLDVVKNNWQVDPNRILLTGISDGGTFALICSLQQQTPFTAFAPIASTLPPMDISNAKGKRILWTHGALDWMFPVQIIQMAYEMLKTAGADITLRVINDLSHTYPRDENDNILAWFDPSLALSDAT